jgi:hypothetical protein
MQEHLGREMKASVDEVWIKPLQKNRGGYAQVTIKEHLTTKESKAMKKQSKLMESHRTHCRAMEGNGESQGPQAERWDLVINDQDMVEHAYVQMDESGIFDKKHLMDWERKETHEKTWGNIENVLWR